MDPLLLISPIDGRYQKDTEVLSTFFSESALMRYRIRIEIEYLIALSLEPSITEISPLSTRNQTQLRRLYLEFTLAHATQIKNIESETKHDVKAIEYYIASKLEHTPLETYIPFIHFGLTSEDINNLAYALMWKDALEKVYIPELKKLYSSIQNFSQQHKEVPLLSLTHGQPATPTTLGKEYAVFASRLSRQITQLTEHLLQGKCAGATGTWAAHVLSYSNTDWIAFSTQFVASLGLEHNQLVTQVESRDTLAESYHTISRINTILIDLCRDTWMYISRGILAQKKKEGEVGSSTMPHKINPIRFENAEGNCGLANSLFTHLAQKLPISRMQRDLSDSTVIRNQGSALAYSLLACKNIIKGIKRITPNIQKCDEELDSHWEVLAEAIQTLLRKEGYKNAYEILKETTRGQIITKQDIQNIIQSLPLSEDHKQQLLKLSPHTYLGYSKKLQ